MFCLNENNIYHLYTQGVDMRKGVEGLCGIIRTYVSILCRPYCIKQISQSPDRLTLAYLFYTIRPA